MCLKSQISRLREKINDKDGITVDADLNDDLKDMVEKSRGKVKVHLRGTAGKGTISEECTLNEAASSVHKVVSISATFILLGI